MDTCTPAEALFHRKRLRLLGEDKFLAETVEARTITAKKLCTAFGIRLPSFLDGQPDISYYPLLGLCISRELSKRLKLPQYNSVDDAVSLLKKSKNIIVLTGAGVSIWCCTPISKLKFYVDINKSGHSRFSFKGDWTLLTASTFGS